ncbi:RNA polymerase sigma factor [Flagellimonas myxillae]|uniref:RNA polymerase sigma factor n=1 Tax=Flagellimonas myxillae TaxID=2942214 RepID=UPI00201EB1F0|nr:RNA polymerase sigma-70 factor [Muricauda myxillae]MCL6266728.1 RNA polymerase sigma-70 factor [Muricauda myxillae]
MGEEILFRQIKQDDAGAMKELFHLYYEPLCTYIFQFTQSSAHTEDIVQSVFIKLWEKRQTLTITTSLKAYLYRSAYNHYVDKFREGKKKTKLLEDLKYEALSCESQDDNSLFHQKLERIKNLMDSLPERCQQIILLSKQEGFKNREIAEKLGISIKTVEAQLRIAFQKIRDGFEEKKILFLLFGR